MLKFLILLCVSSFAMAGSVNLDFRFESDSSSYNNAAKAAGSTASTSYLMRTGRVDFKGKLNEELNYRLRWRFDKDSSTAQNKTDNFSSQIDYAYVQHTLVEGLTLTLGKLASEIGSVEGNQPSTDIYLQSQAYRQISSKGFLYVTGAKISYQYEGHEGSAYVINQSETTATDQSKSSYGLTYKASFMEKTLSTIVGYLSDEKQNMISPDNKVTTTITSAGVKWEPKPYYINFDYIIFAEKNVSAVGTNDTFNTMILEAGYDFDDIIPKIKYEITDKKTDAAASVKEKYDGLSVGAEYRPFSQDTFRYHLMVTQLNIKADGSDSRYEQHFLIGTKIYADFLK